MSIFDNVPKRPSSLMDLYLGRMGAPPPNALSALGARQPQQARAYGNRTDGTPKGRGFLGEIRTGDGRVMTELSVGVDWGEGEQEIPALVPTLTPEEVKHLAKGGQPTDAIVDKAIRFAIDRRRRGLPVFATPGVDY